MTGWIGGPTRKARCRRVCLPHRFSFFLSFSFSLIASFISSAVCFLNECLWSEFQQSPRPAEEYAAERGKWARCRYSVCKAKTIESWYSRNSVFWPQAEIAVSLYHVGEGTRMRILVQNYVHSADRNTEFTPPINNCSPPQAQWHAVSAAGVYVIVIPWSATVIRSLYARSWSSVYDNHIFKIGKSDRLIPCLRDRLLAATLLRTSRYLSGVSGRPRVVQHRCDRLTCCARVRDTGREGQRLQSCMRCKCNAKPKSLEKNFEMISVFM